MGFVGRIIVLGLALCLAPTVGAQAPVPETETEDSAEKQRKIRELRRRVQQHISTQKWEEAAREMKELVILDRYNADYQLTLGLLYRKQKQLDEAARKYQDFLDLGGNAAVAHLLKAEAFAAKGEKAASFEELHKAAENGMNIMRAVKQFESMASFRTDTDFIKLALQLEKYELEMREFTDIFTSRFKHEDTTAEDDALKLAGPGHWNKEKQEKTLRKAKLYLSNIQHYLVEGNENRAMHFYTELLKILEEQSKFTIPVFASEIRAIINQKEEIERGIEEIRLKYFYEQAKGVIDQMTQSFRNEDYPEVEKLYSRLQNIAANINDINPEFKQVSKKVLDVGDGWVRRAQIRREFVAKPLKIQGIILHDGPAHAIVNDKYIEEGRGFQDMQVFKIEPNQIIFDYKGERVPLVFRRY
ncbi:MAG: tetratricopeptide repeat protein [Planctomycetota bacterium]